MSAPTNGESNWGTPLNSYMSGILSTATTALTDIGAHEVAVDPHGDRAYALSLVTPITSGVNSANGYVKLNSSGQVPNNLLPSAGGLSDVYDVSSSTFGAVGNGSTDDTTAIQAALTAAATAGGGEVWIPNGQWAISSTLLIGNNTWLHLSPGATLWRKINAVSGLPPTVLVANFNASTSNTSITGNILVSGGTWDMTTQGTFSTSGVVAIQLANAQFCGIEQTEFIMPQNSPAVQAFGMTSVVFRDNLYTNYAQPTLSLASTTAPAIQLSAASTAELPAGLNGSMYTNAMCNQISLDNQVISEPYGGYATSSGVSYGGYGYLLGSVFPYTTGVFHQNLTVANCIANGLAQNLWQCNEWENVYLSNMFFGVGFNTVNGANIITSTTNYPAGNPNPGYIVSTDNTGLPSIRTTNTMLDLDIEQWTIITTGMMQNGFAETTGGSQGPRAAYRVNMQHRTFDISGDVRLPTGSATYNAVAFFSTGYGSLSYNPLNTKRWPCFPYAQTSYGNVYTGPVRVEWVNGNLQLNGLAGGMNGTNVDISGFGIPMDY